MRFERYQEEHPVGIACTGKNIGHDFDRFAGLAVKNTESELAVSGTGQLLIERHFRDGNADGGIRNRNRQLRKSDSELGGIRSKRSANDLNQDICIFGIADNDDTVTGKLFFKNTLHIGLVDLRSQIVILDKGFFSGKRSKIRFTESEIDHSGKQKLLNSGTSMYKLIGSQYNEDVSTDYLTDAYGYYFPRGVMDEKYENAAFTMEVGDNVIVESTAKNSKGVTVPCIYLIERLSTSSSESKTEIEKNLETLSTSLSDAIINDKKEEVKKNLSFTPNDYAKSLDISNLEPVSNGVDYQAIIVISASVVACALIIGATILITRARTKRFHQKIKKN